MFINKKQSYYLKDGKLDLSLLNEEIHQASDKETDIMDEIESIKVNDMDISESLEEVALMFEEEENFKKAFNEARLEDEMKEFQKKIDKDSSI